VQTLSTFFRKVLIKNPSDLIHVVYLAANDVAPSYDCVELGVGESFLIKAIGEACGTEAKIIKKKLETIGDLGLVAEQSKGKQRTLSFAAKPKPVSALEVLTMFRKVASISGSGTQSIKIGEIKKLLVRSSSLESKFIIRGLQGKVSQRKQNFALFVTSLLVVLRSTNDITFSSPPPLPSHSLLLPPPPPPLHKVSRSSPNQSKSSKLPPTTTSTSRTRL